MYYDFVNYFFNGQFLYHSLFFVSSFWHGRLWSDMKITLVCDMLVHDFFYLCVLRTLLSNNPNVILRVMCSIHSSAVSKQPEDRCTIILSTKKT